MSKLPRTLDEWATQTAQMIIWGLLREEGWELPGTGDEAVTTRALIQSLKEAVIARLKDEESSL